METKMRVIVALWGVLAIVWGTSALYDSKPTVKAQSSGSRLVQTALLLSGFFLLSKKSVGFGWLDQPMIHEQGWVQWAGVWVVLAGVAFAIWARITLGGNWSGPATLKVGHTIARRGPYRFVRHPIYTGILLGVVGTAVTAGSLHALLAIPLCGLSYFLKIQSEESLLIGQFGNEYVQYQQQTKSLVPFLF
jgi:protein-S-isoprenylcysteine O-methyltransferase Ste14